jgi:hypothetical protein
MEPVGLNLPEGVALVATWSVGDGPAVAVCVALAVALPVAPSVGLVLGIAVEEGDADAAGPPGRPPLGPVRQAAKPTPATSATVTAAATPTKTRGLDHVREALGCLRMAIAAATSPVARTESCGVIER